MEILLSQLTASLVVLSGILSANTAQAAIMPYSMPTDAVYSALEGSRLNVPPLLWEIGQCESGHDLKAKNAHSSAKGEYQFIKSSWQHYGKELWGDDWVDKDIYSKDNEELAIYVFNKYGTSDWNESKDCWLKKN